MLKKEKQNKKRKLNDTQLKKITGGTQQKSSGGTFRPCPYGPTYTCTVYHVHGG